MSDDSYRGLARDLRPPAAPTARMGKVLRVEPLRVLVGGNAQEEGALLRNASLGELKVGDGVLCWPIEEEQRYILLCRVVGT